MVKVTRKLEVEIEGVELLSLLVEVLRQYAVEAEGKEQALFYALGQLAGLEDVKAVHIANRRIRLAGSSKITTKEFRRWLPRILSKAFASLQPARER